MIGKWILYGLVGINLLLFISCGSAQVAIDRPNKVSASNKTLFLEVVPDTAGLAATTGMMSSHQHASWLDDPTRVKEFDSKAQEVFLGQAGNKGLGALQGLNLSRVDLVTIDAKAGGQFVGGTAAGFNANATSAGLTNVNLKKENIARVMSELKIESITLVLLSAQDNLMSGKRVGAEVICFDSDGVIIRYKDIKNLTLFSSWTGKFEEILNEYRDRIK